MLRFFIIKNLLNFSIKFITVIFYKLFKNNSIFYKFEKVEIFDNFDKKNSIKKILVKK